MHLLVVLTFATACLSEAYGQQYTDRFDNTDLNVVIHNRRLLIPYVKCVLDQGKCNAEGIALKEHLADAMQSGCSKCTEKQRNGANLVIHHLILNENELWQQLVAKYKAENNLFVKKYESEATENEEGSDARK